MAHATTFVGITLVVVASFGLMHQYLAHPGILELLVVFVGVLMAFMMKCPMFLYDFHLSSGLDLSCLTLRNHHIHPQIRHLLHLHLHPVLIPALLLRILFSAHDPVARFLLPIHPLHLHCASPTIVTSDLPPLRLQHRHISGRWR